MTQFVALLHGKGLRLLAEDRSLEIGGVYAWRMAEAENPTEATALLTSSFHQELIEDTEIWNRADEPIEVEIDEIYESAEAPENGSGLIFYVEEQARCSGG